MEHQQRLKVADTYQDRSVFVTGASGFLGKVLVEKLLYSLPQIKKIYLLIRPLKNDSPAARLDKMLQSTLFNRIRASNESLFKKLIPIPGDIMDPELGLSEEHQSLLCEEVSIVFHSAATVKFDEALKISVSVHSPLIIYLTQIEMNVIGTKKIIALCHRMKHLIAVVHASTAYANCNLSRTEERVYDPRINAPKLVEGASWMSNQMFDSLAPHLLNNRPNTYTLSKALAESILVEEARDLPLVIIRPSIIGAVWKEPLPGWTDNLNGPTAIFTACGKGLIGNMCGSVKSTADIIPVDIVANMLIVAASHRANLKMEAENPIPIMHCCSGALNPLKWNRIVYYLEQFYLTYPLDNCAAIPSTRFHTTRRMFLILFYLKHYLPAHVLDVLCRLVKKKPTFVRLYLRIWKMVETLHYFTTRGWYFESGNLLKLWEGMSDEDRKVYNFDVRQIDWDKYLFDYLMGVKVYLLNESLEDLPKARANLAWLRQVNIYTNAGVWALIVRLVAWKRTRKQKWTVWLSGFLITYALQNFNFRPRVNLRSLEDYKATQPYYATHKVE